jgi:hypothetical protein
MKIIYTILMVMVTLSLSCSNGKSNPAGNVTGSHDTWPEVSVASAASYLHHIKAELLSDDSLYLGYDSLAIVLRDSASGKVLTNAQVKWYPILDSGTTQSTAPVDSYGNAASADSLFLGGVLFLTPSDSTLVNGGWLLRLRIRDNRYASTGDFNDSTDLSIHVKNVSPLPLVLWKGSDGLQRVTALVAPKSPISGTNVLELFIAKKTTEQSWIADTSWIITFISNMPSMKCVSPNCVNPSHTGNGHYKGIVNYTMSGDWRFTFTFSLSDGSFTASGDNQYIDVKVK